jgi:hypothetical protein
LNKSMDVSNSRDARIDGNSISETDVKRAGTLATAGTPETAETPEWMPSALEGRQEQL